MTHKLKEPLFYAVRTGPYTNRGAEVVAVTTIKSSGRWHGRTIADNEVTHGIGGAIHGRFDTAEQAQAKVDEILAIRRKWKPITDELQLRLTQAWHDEQFEIGQVLKS
jgi:hypothetical protein